MMIKLGLLSALTLTVGFAATQPGYLGLESTRGADGFGITVSYWRSEADILAWKRNAEHAIARPLGLAREEHCDAPT